MKNCAPDTLVDFHTAPGDVGPGPALARGGDGGRGLRFSGHRRDAAAAGHRPGPVQRLHGGTHNNPDAVVPAIARAAAAPRPAVPRLRAVPGRLPVWKSKFNGAFLHAIDATLPRWRGDVGSSSLDGASTAVLSPRNDLVKNIVPEHTGRFPHRRLLERDEAVEVPGRRRQVGGRRELPPEQTRRLRRPGERVAGRAGGLRAPRGLLAGAGRGL